MRIAFVFLPILLLFEMSFASYQCEEVFAPQELQILRRLYNPLFESTNARIPHPARLRAIFFNSQFNINAQLSVLTEQGTFMNLNVLEYVLLMDAQLHHPQANQLTYHILNLILRKPELKLTTLNGQNIVASLLQRAKPISLTNNEEYFDFIDLIYWLLSRRDMEISQNKNEAFLIAVNLGYFSIARRILAHPRFQTYSSVRITDQVHWNDVLTYVHRFKYKYVHDNDFASGRLLMDIHAFLKKSKLRR